MLRAAIGLQEPLAAELPERTEFREDLALSLCKLGEVLHHRKHSIEAEEVLRRSIKLSNDLIHHAPQTRVPPRDHRQCFDRPGLPPRDKGRGDTSEGLLADASAHIWVGLQINPLDPHLSRLISAIECGAKRKATPRIENTSR